MNNPLIVVVDDVLEVLRTIVRDLRSQYDANYRVRCSSSREKMLEALPKFKLRGKSISLFKEVCGELASKPLLWLIFK